MDDVVGRSAMVHVLICKRAQAVGSEARLHARLPRQKIAKLVRPWRVARQ